MQPDIGLVAARFVSMAALLALAGVPLYFVTLRHWRLGRPVRLALAVLAVLLLPASLWWAAASVAAMAAMPLSGLDRDMLFAVLEATPLGIVLAVRVTAAACVLLSLAISPRTLPVLLMALVALASSAWTGHSGASEGIVQPVLDSIHLGAAALWLGALLVFVTCLAWRTGRSALIQHLSAFSGTGTAVVIVLAVTGAINAYLIGSAGWSAQSGWSLLLAAKIALFLAMLGLAAANRWRFTPALARGAPGAERHLVWSLGLESACAVAIIALVAILGLIDPSGA